MAKIVQTAGRDQLGEFAPMFAAINDDVLFGEVWSDDACAALELELTPAEVAYLEEPYSARELVGPKGRPGEKPLAGTMLASDLS